MELDLGAQLDAWTKQTTARMLAVYKGSVQEFISRAQNRIPVDTGFARASLQGSFQSMPLIDQASAPKPGEKYYFDFSVILLQINALQPGQTFYFGWTANYVQYLEYGSSQQAPNGFIGVTALEWPQIVAGEIEKAKASAGAV